MRTMGFALSILYFVTYYLTPPVIFGPLAAIRIELILALLLMILSIPRLMNSFVLKSPQSLAMIGLLFAASLSVLIGVHWASGAAQMFLEFIPNTLAYFFVCLHCNTRKRIQIFVAMLIFVCAFVIVRGSIDLHRVVRMEMALQADGSESPYLMGMSNSTEETVYRLRGLGLINDPNDFGQLIVCVIPLVFIFWRTRKMLHNLVWVIAPVCLLLYGAFLTHSRGALLALMAMAVVAARRRIGLLPALLMAGALFAAAMSLHFTGGRDISAEAGADRTELWSESLQVLKTHPFFGVGFGNLPDYLGHTSHNSVMVCAAELGSVGLFFWCLFLFPTMRDVLTIASRTKPSEGIPEDTGVGRVAQFSGEIEIIDDEEIRRLGRLLLLSLTGFLVAGWFLSRAFVMTLFSLGAIVEVIYEVALRQGMVAPRLRLARLLPYAGALAVFLILLMYALLRVTNRMQ